MSQRYGTARKFGRLRYDPVTGTWVLSILVFAAVVLGIAVFIN